MNDDDRREEGVPETDPVREGSAAQPTPAPSAATEAPSEEEAVVPDVRDEESTGDTVPVLSPALEPDAVRQRSKESKAKDRALQRALDKGETWRDSLAATPENRQAVIDLFLITGSYDATRAKVQEFTGCDITPPKIYAWLRARGAEDSVDYIALAQKFQADLLLGENLSFAHELLETMRARFHEEGALDQTLAIGYGIVVDKAPKLQLITSPASLEDFSWDPLTSSSGEAADEAHEE
jgi:hypothetical protein